jgi:hypothetical protein
VRTHKSNTYTPSNASNTSVQSTTHTCHDTRPNGDSAAGALTLIPTADAAAADAATADAIADGASAAAAVAANAVALLFVVAVVAASPLSESDPGTVSSGG